MIVDNFESLFSKRISLLNIADGQLTLEDIDDMPPFEREMTFKMYEHIRQRQKEEMERETKKNFKK